MLTYKSPDPVLLYRTKSGTENAAYMLVTYRQGTSKIAVSVQQLAALSMALCLAAGWVIC